MRNPFLMLGVSFFLSLLLSCGGGGSGGGGSNGAATTSGNIANNAPIKSKLSGKVTDKSGVAVAGVTITVFHHNTNTSVTTLTDANGQYAVSGLDTVNNADYGIYAEKAGIAVYPHPAEGAGKIAKMDFNGLYRTLIRFTSMPAHDVTGADFTAYRATDKVASLPKTGQKMSYAQGDDSASQKGVVWPDNRFIDNANGTVTDRLTGLIWLKNAGCFQPTDWPTALASANSLASGSCGLSDNSTAGQWRLPNANELESLVDVSQINPSVAQGSPFAGIYTKTAYWTSTTYTALPSNAMAIRFSDGRWINGIDIGDNEYNNDKLKSSNGTWAVKSGNGGAVQVLATGVFFGDNLGGAGQTFGAHDDAELQLGAPLTSPRFIDNNNGTLVDTVTGLVWLKQGDCIKQTWAGALAQINNLATGQCGLSDGSSAGQWRMPNRNEMLSLSDRAPTFPQASYLNGQYHASSVVSGPVVFNQFIVSDYYWTSTTDAADPTQAWSIYSCDFGIYNLPKTDTRFALAVR